MKSVYWRPKKVTSTATLMIGLFALTALVLVELLPRLQGSEQFHQQQHAMELAARCRAHIQDLRQRRGLALNELFDPQQTGLVGTAMSPITSKPGNLESKQLSLHPQFPAAIVQMLSEAGVTSGDTVAIGWTGSFPGLNIALAAATEALDVRTTVVASVTASQYGANEPNLTWLDMETALYDAGLVKTRAIAASVGGPADRGVGMSEQTHELARAAMERNGVRQLEAKRLNESIDRRVMLATAPIRPTVYINVGGGVASNGGRDSVFPSGVSMRAPSGEGPDCVLNRFAEQGIPVINLASPRSLAEKYKLAHMSLKTSPDTKPKTLAAEPSRVGALIALLVVCAAMYVSILSDVGARCVTSVAAFIRRKPSLRAIAKQDGPQLMV